MASPLSLFPARVAIVDANGLATPAFLRALTTLLERAGTLPDEVEVLLSPFGLSSTSTQDDGGAIVQPVPATSDDGGAIAQTPQVMDAGPELFQNSAQFVDLFGYSIRFKDATGSFVSLFTNANTAARTYTYQDRTMTVAGVDDITGGTRAANFTSYSASGTPGITAVLAFPGTATVTVTNGLITAHT